jgi:hypothetical protein
LETHGACVYFSGSLHRSPSPNHIRILPINLTSNIRLGLGYVRIPLLYAKGD